MISRVLSSSRTSARLCHCLSANLVELTGHRHDAFRPIVPRRMHSDPISTVKWAIVGADGTAALRPFKRQHGLEADRLAGFKAKSNVATAPGQFQFGSPFSVFWNLEWRAQAMPDASNGQMPNPARSGRNPLANALRVCSIMRAGGSSMVSGRSWCRNCPPRMTGVLVIRAEREGETKDWVAGSDDVSGLATTAELKRLLAARASAAAAQGARSLATTGSQRIVTPARTPTGVSPVSSTIRGLP